jgi:hypothetical protein
MTDDPHDWPEINLPWWSAALLVGAVIVLGILAAVFG